MFLNLAPNLFNDFESFALFTRTHKPIAQLATVAYTYGRR